MGERLSDLEIQRLKREGRDRLMAQVHAILDAPLPKPRNPNRSRSFWILVGASAALLSAALFLVLGATLTGAL